MNQKKKPEDHSHTGNCWHGLDPHIDVCTDHEQPRGECDECKPCKVCGSDKGWIPLRHGAVFCSPRCGGGAQCGCTWKRYLQAKKDALALATRLGKGWVPIVTENLGWHYHATDSTGLITVNGGCFKNQVATSYTAFITRRIGVSGNFVAEGKTPEEAVLAGLKQLSEEREYLVRLYNNLRDSCSEVLVRSHDMVLRPVRSSRTQMRKGKAARG